MTNKDIKFKTDDFIFSYRTAGIMIKNNKILLQRPSGDDFSYVGGHVSCLETTEETLVREFQEELHIAITIRRLFAVGEIFFDWGGKPCHQICLYFLVDPVEDHFLETDEVFHGFDDDDKVRISVDFCWIPLEQFAKEIVYPIELQQYILKSPEGVVHFISDQIERSAWKRC